MHSLFSEWMTTSPWKPATQVGGGGTGHSSHPGGLQLSNRLHLMIARHSSAWSERLSPAAAREVRYSQNFFPFPQWEEEEEALEDDDLAEDWQKDDPDADLVGFFD